MKKKRQSKFNLNKETIRSLDLSGVSGGLTSFWSCEGDEPVSRGFTNCTYCNGRTQWTDCTEI